MSAKKKSKPAWRCTKPVTTESPSFPEHIALNWEPAGITPPGVIHAPGSYLTHEPQWNSDVNSVFENIVSDEIYPYEFLVENCPEDKKRDLDYVMGLLDWEKNIDPHYRKNYFRSPGLSPAKTSGTSKNGLFTTRVILPPKN